MEDVIYAVSTYTDKCIQNFNNQKVDQAEDNLKIWQNNENKHEVTNFYPDIHFGYCYTRKLFRSRVESFFQVLKDVSLIDEVKQVMLKSANVTSIGCGPGSDIAAYIVLLRSILHSNMRLHFVAVDEIKYWQEFLRVINNTDKNVTIKFENRKFGEGYLRNGDCEGVCIMSYPESVNFGNIWQQLTNKFQLIIILDQSKSYLHSQWKQAGFKINHFIYKGDKNYGYYLSDRRIDMDNIEFDGGLETENNENNGFWNIFNKCTIL